MTEHFSNPGLDLMDAGGAGKTFKRSDGLRAVPRTVEEPPTPVEDFSLPDEGEQTLQPPHSGSRVKKVINLKKMFGNRAKETGEK